MLKNDSWNRKLWPLIRRKTLNWLPIVPETSLLWLQFIGYSVWPKGYWVRHGSTNYLDMQVIDKGNMVVTCGDKKYTLEENDAVIIPPGESTLNVGSAGFCEKKHLGIIGRIFLNVMHEMNLDKPAVLPGFRTPEFLEIYDSLFLMTESALPENVHEFAAQTYKLLLLISDRVEKVPFPDELVAAKSYVDWNFSKPLTLEDIYCAAGCGRSTLQWQFGHYLGTTPTRYLTSIRMKFAQRCLEDCSLSIKTISDRCGYENPLYFSNVFKAHFGCSPRAYRKQKKQEI